MQVDREDAIAGELLRMSLGQISMEMASNLKRISGSTIITEADDFTVLLYSASGELLNCPMGPVFSGPGSMAIRKLIEQFGADGFTDGDVFLGNDPFSTGALHANDMQIIVPVLENDICVGFTYMHAHVMDIGGLTPGSWSVGASDCYGEAFRLPFVKYCEGGRVNELVRSIVAINTRLPALVLNDIQGMATAAQVGAARLKKLVTLLGANRYAVLLGDMIDRTERAARTRLETLIPGIYETTGWIEHNGQRNDLFGLRGRMTVEPKGLQFEFTGVAQTNGFVNATPQALIGKVTATVAAMLFWDIPINEGIRRVLEVRALPGTVTCANPPAPVSANHIEGGLKLGTMINAMLAASMKGSPNEGIASRAHAPFGDSAGVGTFAGIDCEGAYQVVYDNLGLACGSGAGPTMDGLDSGGQLPAAAIRIPDIESLEADYPIMFLWRRLGTDSGGAGEHRGGVGVDGAWTLIGADSLTGANVTSSWQLPVRGAEGGYPGGTTKAEVVAGIDVVSDWIAHGRLPKTDDLPQGRVIPCKATGIPLKNGEVWRMRTPGGGGWGDPLARDPAAVVRDVRLGAVTLAVAGGAYGVSLDDSATGFNAEATQALRQRARAQRLKYAAPEKATKVGQAICRHCGGHASAHHSKEPLAMALATFGAYAEPRTGVDLAFAVCPDCASLRQVDITVDQSIPEIPANEYLMRLL